MYEAETQTKSNLLGERLLIYLLEYTETYDEINAVISKYNLELSNIFLPNTITVLDKEFTINEKLCLQLLSFLDIVKFYSFILYGDENYFTSHINKIIISNRKIKTDYMLLGKEKYDSILFNEEGGLDDLILNNVSLVSLYIFTLLKQISSES